VAVALSVVSCGPPSEAPGTLAAAHVLRISVQVLGVDLSGVPGQARGDCRSARAGYEVGTEVVIRDEGGTRIATTHLGQGRGTLRNGVFVCRLPFETPVPDVRTYTLSVHDVVIATMTHADLEESQWGGRIDVDEG